MEWFWICAFKQRAIKATRVMEVIHFLLDKVTREIRVTSIKGGATRWTKKLKTAQLYAT